MGKLVEIVQSNRLPWKGYFGLLVSLLLSSCFVACSVQPAMPKSGCATPSASPVAPRVSTSAIALNAAPQDGHVFLTWNRVEGVERYIIHWQQSGDKQWDSLDVGTNLQSAVVNLQNGSEYKFRLSAVLRDRVLTSSIVTQTPRARPDCSYPNYYGKVSVFCSQPAADAWLRDNGIDPLRLKCRNRPLSSWDLNSPDCLYTVDDKFVLLLRSVDHAFSPPAEVRDAAMVRSLAKKILWPQGNPFDNPEQFFVKISEIDSSAVRQVTKAAQARSYRITYHPQLSSRVTWFSPAQPLPGRYAIYLEGHSGSASEIGAETIDWLLQRGWEVVSIDMPLIGANQEDVSDTLTSNNTHNDFDRLDDGFQSPVGLFFIPVKAVVDLIFERNAGAEAVDLMMIGRSGGGWTTYAYSALDPRVDIAVSVAGGVPLSQRLKDREDDLVDVGDYEQSAPHLYDIVTHEDLMVAAGSKASFYIYNQFDTCCFRLVPHEAFVQYLEEAAVSLHKIIRVYVDEENHAHTMSSQAYFELEQFLNAVLKP